jgi:hypothetical protein
MQACHECGSGCSLNEAATIHLFIMGSSSGFNNSAFAKVCFYIIDDTRKEGLVEHPKEWTSLHRSTRAAIVPKLKSSHCWSNLLTTRNF